jgi:hypothetical protein
VVGVLQHVAEEADVLRPGLADHAWSLSGTHSNE